MPVGAPQFNCYQTRIKQLVDGLEHVYKLYHLPGNYADLPGQAPNAYEVVQADLNLVAWDAAVEEFLAVYKSQFSTDSAYTAAELWKADADTFDFNFLSAFTPVAQPTVIQAYVPACTSIFTARTASGHIMRITTIEGRTTGNTVLPWDALDGGTSVEQLGYDVCQAPDRRIVDRYGTFPFAPLKQNRGQNEAVWRKRFRP